MAVTHPGVDVADGPGGAPACDLMRLRRLDLLHVPLERTERVGVRRSVREIANRRPVAVGLFVWQPSCEPRGRGDVLDPVVLEQVAPERRAVGLRDRNTDLVVAVDECSTGS